MLAIGRALMGEPKLLLIDEVSMGLMPIFVDRVFELIKKIHSEGMTILLVEQNAKKALAWPTAATSWKRERSLFKTPPPTWKRTR